MYKNIEKQAKLNLKDLVAYQPGQVVSKTLVQNDKVSMTIFPLTRGRKSPPMPPEAMQWSLFWRAKDDSPLRRMSSIWKLARP